MHRSRLHLARWLLAAVSACAAYASLADPVALDWADLIPAQQPSRTIMRGIVQHDQMPPDFGNRPIGKYDSMPEAPVRTDLDGREVRMLGYVTPMRFEGEKLMEFLLVPYQGACIHVPPPPANQIVFIDSKEGVHESAYYELVSVKGRLRVAPMSTDLADVGYQMEGAAVEIVKN